MTSTRIFSVVLISFLLSLFFNSCDFISEPERIINNDAKPLITGTFEFQDFAKGQHIDGKINFVVNTSSVNFSISDVRLVVDSDFAGWADSYPYTFTLDTRNYNEGTHRISILIYKKNSHDHGMLNLLHPPEITLSTELVFDQSPPLPVTLSLTKTPDGKKVLLSWSKSTNANFAAYRIFRSYGQGWKILDTIYQKNSTSFTDSSIEPVYNLPLKYAIEVNTSYEIENWVFHKWSNEALVYYGKTLDYFNEGSKVLNIIINKNRSELYFLLSSKLVAFSTAVSGLFRDVYIEGAEHGYNSFCISKDNSRIYVFEVDYSRIVIVDAASFSILKTINFSFDISPYQEGENKIYHLDGDKVILVTNDRYIRVIDTATETIVSSSYSPFLTVFETSAITEDRSQLLISQSYNSERKLVVRNLLDDSLSVINEKMVNITYGELAYSPDGSTVYGLNAGGEINVLNPLSLDIVTSITTENRFHAFGFDSHNLYGISYSRYESPEITIELDKVFIYDINSFEMKKSWPIIFTWGNPVSDDNNFYILTTGSGSAALEISIDDI